MDSIAPPKLTSLLITDVRRGGTNQRGGTNEVEPPAVEAWMVDHERDRFTRFEAELNFERGRVLERARKRFSSRRAAIRAGAFPPARDCVRFDPPRESRCRFIDVPLPSFDVRVPTIPPGGVVPVGPEPKHYGVGVVHLDDSVAKHMAALVFYDRKYVDSDGLYPGPLPRFWLLDCDNGCCAATGASFYDGLDERLRVEGDLSTDLECGECLFALPQVTPKVPSADPPGRIGPDCDGHEYLPLEQFDEFGVCEFYSLVTTEERYWCL